MAAPTHRRRRLAQQTHKPAQLARTLTCTAAAAAALAFHATPQYKDNCCLVIIDWLFRHGYLTPDMPGYCQLLTGLRSGDCR